MSCTDEVFGKGNVRCSLTGFKAPRRRAFPITFSLGTSRQTHLPLCQCPPPVDDGDRAMWLIGHGRSSLISVECSTRAMRQSPIQLFGKTDSSSSAAWACGSGSAQASAQRMTS
jgi:hypothetical protein